ncbi:MAM domain-containing glycosylphosphatidylinositol anchor protein 2-like [Strongylocentrotus purpuratus]|uniref:MAM domain-containing protein n=1 Tax=Strongylocentrotus purpuratus TaxID=7668 RepID=A0A7M7N8Y4_STRPU|nr:MAM domain-containing glycosylphosphatidylinositol anchor protein 2-like [Strongylocentrotus purpuratus]
MYCFYDSNLLRRHHHRFPPFPLLGGNFLYSEANVQYYGEKARIYSPFDSPANEAGTDMTMISFWYSMWDGFDGTNWGTLNVYIAYGGEKVPVNPPFWSRSGSQTDGSGWKEAKIMFTAPSPFRIIFEGVVGEGNRSDIGIDDVMVRQPSRLYSIVPE